MVVKVLPHIHQHRDIIIHGIIICVVSVTQVMEQRILSKHHRDSDTKRSCASKIKLFFSAWVCPRLCRRTCNATQLNREVLSNEILWFSFFAVFDVSCSDEIIFRLSSQPVKRAFLFLEKKVQRNPLSLLDKRFQCQYTHTHPDICRTGFYWAIVTRMKSESFRVTTQLFPFFYLFPNTPTSNERIILVESFSLHFLSVPHASFKRQPSLRGEKVTCHRNKSHNCRQVWNPPLELISNEGINSQRMRFITFRRVDGGMSSSCIFVSSSWKTAEIVLTSEPVGVWAVEQ